MATDLFLRWDPQNFFFCCALKIQFCLWNSGYHLGLLCFSEPATVIITKVDNHVPHPSCNFPPLLLQCGKEVSHLQHQFLCWDGTNSVILWDAQQLIQATTHGGPFSMSFSKAWSCQSSVRASPSWSPHTQSSYCSEM